MMTDATWKGYISTPYVNNDEQYLFLLHSIEYIFKDMSCPVVIMHYIICSITQNILQFDDWVYLIVIVGDTNGQEILLPLNQL